MNDHPSTNHTQRPIGVFDSGVGGLTVAKAIHRALPQERILYLGDTARVPYGSKSKDVIQQYTREILAKMETEDVKAIVVACNTVSALAHEVLASQKGVAPIIDVLTAGVDATLHHLRSQEQHPMPINPSPTNPTRTVGVLGTTATIASQAYERQLKHAWPNLRVLSQACPLLVPLAEEGWDGQSEVVRYTLSTYLEPLQNPPMDALILGCTHYPLFKDAIASELSSSPLIIDSGEAVARTLKLELQKNHLLHSPDESSQNTSDWLECWVTDRPDHVQGLAERILGERIANVRHLTLGS